MSVDEKRLQNFIQDELSGDEASFKELLIILEGFFQEILNFSRSQSGLEDLKLLSHKVKSSCRSFAALTLADLLEKTEHAANDQKEQEAFDYWEKAKLEIPKTSAELKRLSEEYFRSH